MVSKAIHKSPFPIPYSIAPRPMATLLPQGYCIFCSFAGMLCQKVHFLFIQVSVHVSPTKEPFFDFLTPVYK